MSQIKRSSLVRGACQLEYQGEQFLAATKTDAKFELGFKPIPSAFAGGLKQVRTSRKGTVSLDLVGTLIDFDVLFPYRDPAVFPLGRSIIQGPLVLRPLDPTQKQRRYFAAGLRKLTGCKFSATDPLFAGQTEFGIFPQDDTDDADPALYYVEEDNEIVSVGIAYDPADLIVSPYKLSWLSTGTAAFHWGADATSALPIVTTDATELAAAINAGAAIIAAGLVTVTGDYINDFIVEFVTNGSRSAFSAVIAGNVPAGLHLVQTVIVTGDGSHKQKVRLSFKPWANFTHESGVTADFGITTKTQGNNALGDVDEYLTDVTASVKATPQGPTDSEMIAALNIQGPGSQLGLVSGIANDLNVIGSGVYMRLNGAILTDSPQSFGLDIPRTGESTWVAQRSAQVGGILDPLFEISTTPLVYT